MTVEGTIELAIPPDAAFLSVARGVVAAAATIGSGFAEDRLAMLRLAVSEATTNAIRAHTAAGIDETIQIRCQVTSSQVEVEVTDHGLGFDPDAARTAPDPDDPTRLEFEGGLGLPLMRWCADQTEIESGPTGTRVRLVLFSTAERPR